MAFEDLLTSETPHEACADWEVCRCKRVIMHALRRTGERTLTVEQVTGAWMIMRQPCPSNDLRGAENSTDLFHVMDAISMHPSIPPAFSREQAIRCSTMSSYRLVPMWGQMLVNPSTPLRDALSIASCRYAWKPATIATVLGRTGVKAADAEKVLNGVPERRREYGQLIAVGAVKKPRWLTPEARDRLVTSAVIETVLL